MKVLLSWLREFAPFADEPDALAHSLSMLGTTVESMERIGEYDAGIVVARVVELRRHPKAERIQRVVVEVADGRTVEVWCGAFNMEVGDLVPLATVGTVMPGGMEIGRRKILGEYSDGMFCSPVELGLGGDAGGILILPDQAEPGTPLAQALGLEADVLYDLEVNPNRPDAMSVAGVARDLAAWYRLPFDLPTPNVDRVGEPATSSASVEILDSDLCGRFTASVLRGIAVGPSPAPIANRLTLLGMRPINNVVDASNYVMLELGQPNHPYDLATLPGGAIRVRRARPGETMVTLDDVERRFNADDLLIADGNDTAIGIAGIMGGASTEISDTTRDVLLEMAWFQPMAVATTSRRLGVRSEASARFEKGCDPWVIERAAARFAELLGVAGGAAGPGNGRRPGGSPRAESGRGPPDPGELDHRHRHPGRPRSSISSPRSASRSSRPATTATSMSSCPASGPTPPRRSTSSRRWPGTTATRRSSRPFHRRPTPAPSPRCRETGGRSAGRWSGSAMPRRCRCRSWPRATRPGPGSRENRSSSPTRWWPRSRCCARRCCPACSRRSRSTSRIGHRTQPCSRSATSSGIPPSRATLPDEREHLGVAIAGREAPAAVEALVGVLDALNVPERAAGGDRRHPGHPSDAVGPGRRRRAMTWVSSARSTPACSPRSR